MTEVLGGTAQTAAGSMLAGSDWFNGLLGSIGGLKPEALALLATAAAVLFVSLKASAVAEYVKAAGFLVAAYLVLKAFGIVS